MIKKLRILNLEDSQADSELIQARLEEERIACELVRVETEKDFVLAVELGGYDLLLVDYKLPTFDGMSALAISREICPYIPFIFVSGSIGEDMAIEALKNGATDYVLKDKLSRLAPSVRRALREAEERSEHRKSEEALRESEERYRNVFDTVKDGIYRTDRDGIFVLMNPAGALMFGHRSPEEMIGKKALDYWLDPADREVFQKELRGKKSLKTYLIRARKITGEDLHLETSSIIFEDNNGNLIGIEGILRDITERLKLEAQLRHAQKMEAVGTLAGGIAHDFNNILNVIMGYGSMILDKLEDNSQLKEQMNEVLTAAERAATLTKRLLVFSRKQIVDVKPVNVNQIIVGIQKMLSRVVRENIEINLNFAGCPLIVLADAGQMEQVLMNLATNARDAMPEGGSLTISTGLHELDEEQVAANGYGKTGKYAFITMADTGSGIDAETQKKIFEPFFTTKGIGEGTGLGLAITYGIIKQHNGFIKVYSEPGQGTRFKIYLPLFEEMAESDSKTEDLVSARSGSETILVAEDDAALRNLTMIILESFGYSVITAEDGEDAIKKYIENRDKIQLVILDMIMPKKNGKDTYEEIKKTSPGMKALFMSGYTMDIIKTGELTEAGLDFIHKPVRPQDLLKKVREILDRE